MSKEPENKAATMVACRVKGVGAVTTLMVVAVAAVGFVASSGCDQAMPASEPHGFLTKTYGSAVGPDDQYVVFVPPHRRVGEKRPVILFLNGLGENGEDGLRHISRNFGPQIWQMRDYFPFLGVTYQCPKGGSWMAGSPEAERALAILDEAIANHRGDPDRVILTGCSAGGNGVWSIASEYPHRFAAIVPLCGSGGADSAKLTETGLPVWNFYNEGDAEQLVAFNRTLREQLISAGSSPLVTEYNREGHRCWDRAYVTPALYAWMLEQNRRTNEEGRLFRYLPAEIVCREWESQGDIAWDVCDNEITTSGSADADMAFLGSLDRFSKVEFHLDAHLEPESACRIGLISEAEDDGQTNGFVLSLADPRSGDSELTRVDGRWLASLDPVGQERLLPSDWNDVRLTLDGKKLSVRINGWKSLEFTGIDGGPFRIALFAPDGETAASFRYLRLRIPESASAALTAAP